MSDDTRSFEDVQEEVTRAEMHSTYAVGIDHDFTPEKKHTTGVIDGYPFHLRVDGDAPDELVAEIEAALASVKAGGCTPNSEIQALISEWRERGIVDPYGMTWNPPADELEALIDDDTQAGDGDT